MRQPRVVLEHFTERTHPDRVDCIVLEVESHEPATSTHTHDEHRKQIESVTSVELNQSHIGEEHVEECCVALRKQILCHNTLS